MTEQWKELKETIIELRDNDGTGTQQEVCKFLANLMDELEKQMNKWITIEMDKRTGEITSPLPKNGQEVLITAFGFVYADIFWWDDDRECYFENFDMEEVEAWMPFPEPYMEESEEEE